METKVLEAIEAFKGATNEIKTGIGELQKSQTELVRVQGEITKALEARSQDINQLRKDLDDMRRLQLAAKRLAPARKGEVSEECARLLGGIYIAAGQRQGRLDLLDAGKRDRLIGLCKDILGAEHKTALSSSDIPLPTGYSGEVAELVSQYGAARQYGTVFPLPTGSFKLPRLKTDTTFGLLAIATAVTEKSPQTEFVTFTAEKFGGLVRLPEEIDEDSIVAMGQFIARYCARNIAAVEDAVFFQNVDGSTLGAVKGLCGSTIDNSKVVQMASTKTKYSDATLANLRAIRAAVSEGAIRNGAYYMHTTFEQHLAGLNTAGDKPYIANGVNGASLDGFPIRWVPAMPAYSTSANVSKVFALFGDLSFQYLGTMRGIRMDTSREAAFTTDEILIRAIERFTIGLMATGAVSGLETAAS